MEVFQIFSDYSTLTIAALILLAFTAGFIDAVVGGGGLIQLPALLINLPDQPLPAIFGTNKISALSGTAVSAYQYSRRIKFDYKLLLILSCCAFIASFAGARAVSFVRVDTLKPIILVILVLIAVYTFLKKNLGAVQNKTLPRKKQMMLGSIMALLIGFYDGFFGPGTGSFLVFGFVVVLGFEFLNASAYSKIINCITNISALIVFIGQKNYLLEIAILMAVCNIAGSIIGSKMAMRKGNEFVRIIFLIIVSVMILRYGYDVFVKA